MKGATYPLDNAHSTFLGAYYFLDAHDQRMRDVGKIEKRLTKTLWTKVPKGEKGVHETEDAQEYFDGEALSVFVAAYRADPIIIQTNWSPARSWQLTPTLSIMKTGFMLVSFDAAPLNGDGHAPPLDLIALLEFNERFRYLQLKQYQKHNATEKAKRTFTVKQGITLANHETALASDLITALFAPEQQTLALPGFNKLITCTMAAGEPIADDHFFKFVTLDEMDWSLPAPEYASLQRGAVQYSRWAPQQRFGFTQYSMAWYLDQHQPFYQHERQRICDIHFCGLYAGVMAQIIVHQMSALAVYARELAQLHPITGGYDARISALQKDSMDFVGEAWCTRVSYEVQGYELYQAWSQAAELRTLNAQVSTEIQDSFNYLSMQADREQARILFGAQWFFGAIGLAALWLTAMPGSLGIANAWWPLNTPWVIRGVAGAMIIAGFIMMIVFNIKQKRM